MPGTFVFKPIEANLTHNTDLLGKMNPYCSFIVGNDRVKTQICKKGGKHPQWNDAVTIPIQNQSKIVLEVMDKDRITHDDVIGTCIVDLSEVQTTGQVSKWYPLSYKNKPAGEILIETVFRSDQGSFGNTTTGLNTGFVAGQTGYSEYNQSGAYRQEQAYRSNPTVVQEETTIIQTPGYQQEQLIGSQGYTEGSNFRQETISAPIVQEQVREEVILNQVPDNKVFIEQRQVVEPHTFVKEVDVVETRNVTQQIEVMEPVKVLKDVQYTQAVPVKKQIEVVEPQVVMKEIEVIEPRLVTKEIQVVENVPVTRQVEVIENRTVVQNIETFEPQTFTKQVEVTEHRPVTKNVTVSEPVHLKKAVEFVEPIVTTKTITKQLQEAVIVDESVTQSVGPATVVGLTQETYTTGQAYTTGAVLTEEERLLQQQRYVGGSTTINTVEQERLLLEQERLRQQEGNRNVYTSTYHQHDKKF